MPNLNHPNRINSVFVLSGLMLLFGHVANAQDTSSNIPLYQKRFPWPNVPFKADTGNGERGVQSGEYLNLLLLMSFVLFLPTHD